MEISYQYGYDDGHVKLTPETNIIVVETKYCTKYLSVANKEQSDRFMKILTDNPDLAKAIA